MRSVCQNKLILSLALSLLLLPALVACGSGPAPQELTRALKLADGRLIPDQFQVNQGDTLTLRIESDRPGSIHFHGYDIERELAPGSTAEFRFVADATGRFPITFHAAAEPNANSDHHDEGSQGEPAAAGEHQHQTDAPSASAELELGFLIVLPR